MLIGRNEKVAGSRPSRGRQYLWRQFVDKMFISSRQPSFCRLVVHLDVSACCFSTSSRRLTNSSLHVSLRCLTSSRRLPNSSLHVSLRCLTSSRHLPNSSLRVSLRRGLYFRSLRRGVYPVSGACSLRCVTSSRRFVSSLCHFVAAFRVFVAA
jgi:hypothetical protein